MSFLSRIAWRGLTVLTLCLFASCASMDIELKALASKAPSILTLGDAKFAPINVTTRNSVEFSKQSPAFKKNAKNVYVAGFTLPADAGNTSLYFESPPSTGWSEGVGIILPGVIFLDASNEPLTDHAPRIFFKEDGFLSGVQYVGRVRIPTGAQRFIVYPKLIRRDWPTGLPSRMNLSPVGLTQFQVKRDEVATVEDTIEYDSFTRRKMFVLSEMDGSSVPDARGATAAANAGSGFAIYRTETRIREVPIKKLPVRLVGTFYFGAPIAAIGARLEGTYFVVDGYTTFEAQPWHHYVVRGKLAKDDSTVWIERADDATIVTEILSSKTLDQQFSNQPKKEESDGN